MSDDYRQLERFFTGYEAHDLPYTIEQRSDVVDLFESIEESIELKKATNIAKAKIVSAIDHANPDLISLTDEEKQIIKDTSNSA